MTLPPLTPWKPPLWRRLVWSVRETVLPPACTTCGKPIEQVPAPPYCDACLKKLVTPEVSGLCLRCGMLLAGSRLVSGCGFCPAQPPLPFQACLSAVPYRGPVRELLIRFKTVHGAALAGPLAWLLCYARGALLSRWQPDVIVPVPRHWSRRLRMGHNHVTELAHALASWLGAGKVVAGAVRRVRATRIHRGLGPEERRRNVRRAFRVTRPAAFRDQRVLVLDDVMTSGATLAEVGRVIGRARPKALWAACVARAVLA